MIRLLAVGTAGAIIGVAGLTGVISDGDASAVGPRSSVLTPFAVAVATDDGPENYFHDDEIAIASLDPTGLPFKTYVTGRISSKGGSERSVLDPFTTANVEYLNQRGQPVVKPGGIEVSVGGPEASTTLTRGLMDKPLPVALHAEYTLNGEIVDPNEVLGSSGELEVKYTVTNTDVEQQEISYTDSSGKTATKETPVFAPLTGNLITKLPEEWEATDTSDATISTDDAGDTLLKWNLLVYPPMGDFTQELTFRATMDSGIIPGTVLTIVPAGTTKNPASGFSNELLESSVSGSEELALGLETLDENTTALATGAAELAEGLAQVTEGAETGSQEVSDQLLPGSEQVAEGTAGVALGQAALTEAVEKAAAGADGLSDGVTQLETGMLALTQALGLLADDGLPQLRDGAQLIQDATNKLADTVGSDLDPPYPFPSPSLPTSPTAIPTPGGKPVFPSPSTPPALTPTLYQAVTAAVLGTTILRDQLVELNNNLLPIVDILATSAADSRTAAANATAAATRLEPLIVSLCTPPLNPPTPTECAEMRAALTAATEASATSTGVAVALDGATANLTFETVRAFLTATSSNEILTLLEGIRDGVNGVGQALRSGSSEPGDEGLVEGLQELVGGIDLAIDAAKTFEESAGTIAEGAAQLASGSADLSNGLDQTGQGAAELSAASKLVAEGASLAAFGTAEVASALEALSAGLGHSAEGSAQLAEGTSQLQSEGTARLLESVVDSSAEPAEAVAYLAATDERADTALPYGPPEGATGSAAYIMTMEEVTPNTAGAWLAIALIVLVVSAVGGAVVKQVQTTR